MTSRDPLGLRDPWGTLYICKSNLPFISQVCSFINEVDGLYIYVETPRQFLRPLGIETGGGDTNKWYRDKGSVAFVGHLGHLDIPTVGPPGLRGTRHVGVIRTSDSEYVTLVPYGPGGTVLHLQVKLTIYISILLLLLFI